MIEALTTTALIFGGCCTNVFALESILKTEPNSGLIITFLQFVVVTSLAYTTQFEPGAAYTVRRPRVPLPRWAFIAAMFFAINMLNNWAFAYHISVPVHIILRSFGSVTTMAAGFLRGKRYSPLQVGSVVILTFGVLVSAWADSTSKGKSMSHTRDTSTWEFTQGLTILLVAQFLSAYMGSYTEDTYATFAASWTENLFYTHLLSMPLFLPLAGSLRRQYESLAATPRVDVRQYVLGGLQDKGGGGGDGDAPPAPLALLLGEDRRLWLLPMLTFFDTMPQGLLFLVTNAVTQLVCISGVNLLCAKSSAVTVTVVLNIRKLVSFMLSTVIFGHQLDARMVLGATLVFGSGALYGWETSWRLARQKRAAARGAAEANNGSVVEKRVKAS